MESRQLDDQGHRVSVKVTVAIMATLVLTLGAASSSWADGGSGNCGVTSCNIGGGSGGGQGGGGGSGGGGGGQGGSGGGGSSGGGGGCANTYKKVSDTQLADLQRQGPGALPAQPTLGPGQTADLYYVYDCNGNPTGQIVYIVSGGGGAPVVGNPTPPVNPAVLAAQALKNIPLPAPHIHTNPDITQDQMVGLPIWLWVDAGDLGTKSDSVSAGPVTVTGTLNATSVVWNMGNGDTVTCSGPGTPYDPANPTATPPCGYSYRHSSAAQPNEAYTVTASVTWVGNYTVAGAPGSGPLGPVTRTSTTTVRVAEGQAINNG